MVTAVNDSSFENEVIQSKEPVVVDFWAAWCGPCRMLSPIVDKLAEQYQGKVKFYKLNVDENPVTAEKYGVMSIPTLVFIKDGKQVDTSVGAVPAAKLQPKIEALLQPA